MRKTSTRFSTVSLAIVTNPSNLWAYALGNRQRSLRHQVACLRGSQSKHHGHLPSRMRTLGQGRSPDHRSVAAAAMSFRQDSHGRYTPSSSSALRIVTFVAHTSIAPMIVACSASASLAYRNRQVTRNRSPRPRFPLTIADDIGANPAWPSFARNSRILGAAWCHPRTSKMISTSGILASRPMSLIANAVRYRVI